jgi:hypothetical protein
MFSIKTVFTERAGAPAKQSGKAGRKIVDDFKTALRRTRGG